MQMKVIIEPGEDFGFVVEVPGLPGCVSQGMTEAEALDNIRDAISLWLEVEQEKQGQAIAERTDSSEASRIRLVEV